ncbi:MAG: HNH endonuclease [Betaproteobacteria bacterium]|nr:HNH endonuclease [Betaproteobacteria bacterium]
MDLWLRAPYCSECILSYPFNFKHFPDISSANWEEDIECQLGEEASARAKDAEAEGASSVFQCKRCGKDLAPWNGDEIYIVHYHLEEHYQIPLETAGRTVSKGLKRKILRLYDNKCFACGETKNLHIDHVLPRASGGTAAFRNLQPLCERCGQKKGDSQPEEVEVYSDIYFGPYPSDGYEGLFW